MSLKTYLIILKTGVYLSFISVFLVFKNLLFPFITSKQIPFNILVEILMIGWLALVIKYPEVRPKKSWITFGLIAFFSALLVSSIFGVDFNLSFWGDIERMLGWFHIFHFFLYYLIIITVFRNAKDWRNLFIVSAAVATTVCLFSLSGTSFIINFAGNLPSSKFFEFSHGVSYSTIGNTAYVSGYAIFNIYFALILFFRRYDQEKKKREDWLINALYPVAAFIMFLVMKQTHTRGAYVGLGVSFLLFFILHALYSRSRKIKIYSFAGLALAIIFVGLIFLFPQSSLVRSSQILSTITQISSKQVTFQTRLISWKAALKDFPHHILLGTGYGNFAITFDKYFDPKFYSYTASETYFDRAHNNLVDIASTAGLLGFLTYLSILAAAGYYLVKGKKQNKISTNEFILLVCLFVAYFIQNLAVFDSLVTYISLMVALGYIYWLINGNEEEKLTSGGGLTNKDLAVFAVAGLISLAVVYQYNVKPLMMLDGTIKGQMKFAQGDLAAGVAEYKKALSYETGLDRDSRASLINTVNAAQSNLSSIDKAEAKAIADYSIDLAEQNVKLNPLDSMMQMQLAQALNTAASINTDDKNKFYFYSDRALKAIDEAIKASPGRITIYFSKAQIYITRNEKDKVIETLKYAASLNENYAEAVCYLAKVAVYLKEENIGYSAMDKCLDLSGSGYLAPLDLVKVALNHYSEKKDSAHMIILCERWSIMEPDNAQPWVNLSLLYEQAGEKAKAIAAAEKVGELDPSLKSAAEEFIIKLQEK